EKSSGDDERLIGYLRAISAKSVVQSLKESEKAAEAEEEGQPLLGTQRAQRRCFPYDTGELSARDDFGLGLSRFADVDDSSGFLRLGSAGEVVGLLIWVSRQGLDSCTFRRYGAKTERSKTERSSSSRRQGSKCTTATGVQVGSLREQAGRRGHFGMSTMQCYFTLSLQLLGKESLARPSKRFDDPTAAMQARPLCARCERLAQRGVLMLEKFAWTEEAEKACRSGAFKDAVQQAAPEECVGLSFENLFPKEAVRQFCDRYKGGRSTKEDFFYQHEHTESGVVATLVTPLLKNREFRGYEAANEKEAERSAAEAFTADTEVLEIAERLPPPFSHFTKRAKNSRRKQDDMLAQGLPGGKKGIVQQIAHDRYTGLREQGLSDTDGDFAGGVAADDEGDDDDGSRLFGNAAEDLSFLGRPSVREHPADMPEEASENEMGEDESLQESDAAPRCALPSVSDTGMQPRYGHDFLLNVFMKANALRKSGQTARPSGICAAKSEEAG
ncbi:unnamed protein product, partial [Symbiodinium sp. KB8]